ncbi:hypothetical protein ANCDUO_14585 [Ancylostoma duodenale]|uniref:Uncharacterized protein n=1 Tax=Ancylostoma duodenale TaxID=51022 RepID=A0A0C2CZN6_9BILA|nr:hypothetical protein ANCDUO_14585 [Ancylostoma duodenale]
MRLKKVVPTTCEFCSHVAIFGGQIIQSMLGVNGEQQQEQRPDKELHCEQHNGNMARKIRYDVIGLTDTKTDRPLNATFDTGEELFLGTRDSRAVDVLVNTNLAMNIDSSEQLTTRIGRLRLRRFGSIPALTIFVAYAPSSSYDNEKIEAFYMDLEKFYRKDHTFYKRPPRIRQSQDQDVQPPEPGWNNFFVKTGNGMAGIRRSTFRQQSEIREAAAYAKLRAVSDWTPRDVKRTTGRPATRWSDFFTKSFKDRYDALSVPRTDRIHWTTLARERDKWKDCWRSLGIPEDQRQSR